MGWKVRISGDINDLGMLSKSFKKIKEISIKEEKDGYYLSSIEFNTVTSMGLCYNSGHDDKIIIY
ncbi:MAG TPA: hypothetical protein GXZ27_08445 [Thermoanaerobacterales bacterium]|nr:hypothetical protein [Thermoanaerobacterales bacterium]